MLPKKLKYRQAIWETRIPTANQNALARERFNTERTFFFSFVRPHPRTKISVFNFQKSANVLIKWLGLYNKWSQFITSQCCWYFSVSSVRLHAVADLVQCVFAHTLLPQVHIYAGSSSHLQRTHTYHIQWPLQVVWLHNQVSSLKISTIIKFNFVLAQSFATSNISKTCHLERSFCQQPWEGHSTPPWYSSLWSSWTDRCVCVCGVSNDNFRCVSYQKFRSWRKKVTFSASVNRTARYASVFADREEFQIGFPLQVENERRQTGIREEWDAE